VVSSCKGPALPYVVGAFVRAFVRAFIGDFLAPSSAKLPHALGLCLPVFVVTFELFSGPLCGPVNGYQPAVAAALQQARLGQRVGLGDFAPGY
jgi:hypothetical protein